MHTILSSKDGVGPSRIRLPPGDWPTLLDFLTMRFTAVSRDEWLQRMQRGDVLDERGEPLSPSAPFRAQTVVFYYRYVHDEPRIPFEETVLFQDDLLVAVDKPHFVPVIASGRYVRECLLARLKRRLQIDTLSPLHRIDRDTAGLVLFAVQPDTRGRYMRLFSERRISKAYEAVASWRADLALPLIHRSRLEEGAHYMQMREVPGEPNSETRIELLERRGELARYRLAPLTGKKHQLRAHLAALGIPIVNDRLYPAMQPYRFDDYSNPLQLLARSIEFVDPITQRQRCFASARSLSL